MKALRWLWQAWGACCAVVIMAVWDGSRFLARHRASAGDPSTCVHVYREPWMNCILCGAEKPEPGRE